MALASFTALAMIATAVWARQRGWYPIGDDAILAVRASDVGGSHTPLLGMPTSLGGWGVDGTRLYHPGPLLLWFYAPFVHLFGPAAGLTAAATSLTLFATGLGVWAAYRARGVTAALFAWPLMLMLAGEPFEPLNANVVIAPLAATMLLAWAAASGVSKALPWAMLTGSLVVQAYLPMALPPILACAFALWCTVVPRWRRPGRLPVSALVATGVVFLLAWWAPAYEAVTNRGGNLWGLISSPDGSGAAVGWSGALKMLLWMTSFPPPWTQPMPLEAADATQLIGGGNASGLFLLCAAVFAAIWVWPRWDRGLRRLVTLGAIGLVASAVSTTRLPSTGVSSYQIRWAIALAAFGAFAAGVAIASTVRPRLKRGAGVRRTARIALATVSVAMLVAIALVRPDSPGTRAQLAAEELTKGLSAEVSGDRPLAVVSEGNTWDAVISNSVTMTLITEGREVSVDPVFGHHWGTWRVLALQAGDSALVVSDGFSPGHPDGARLLARAEPVGWSERRSESISEEIANWARANGPIYSRGDSDEMRSIIVGWVPAMSCRRLAAMGDGSEPLDQLPDGAIAQLYLDFAVASPSLPDRLANQLQQTMRVTPTELWLTRLRAPAAVNADLAKLPGIGSALVSC